MKFGYYADREMPVSVALDREPLKGYKVNSHGYRCPEWEPMPDGKKNVVVLGCSHTVLRCAVPCRGAGDDHDLDLDATDPTPEAEQPSSSAAAVEQARLSIKGYIIPYTILYLIYPSHRHVCPPP